MAEALPPARRGQVGPRGRRGRQRARRRSDGPEARDRRACSSSCTKRYEHPRWDEVAERCLTCANCTMVCPTCFCTTVEDATDLTGERHRARRVWDSCFTLDFSYIHGGSVRTSRELALPPVDDAQAGDLDRPVRHLGLRRLRPLHHLVPGRHRHHRGGPGRAPAATRASREGADRDDPRLRIGPGRAPLLQGLGRRPTSTRWSAARANVVFEPGEFIFREGQAADSFYLIRQGHVALEIVAPDQGPITIETLDEGDVLGWSWLFPPYRPASTRAR